MFIDTKQCHVRCLLTPSRCFLNLANVTDTPKSYCCVHHASDTFAEFAAGHLDGAVGHLDGAVGHLDGVFEVVHMRRPRKFVCVSFSLFHLYRAADASHVM